VAGLSLPAGLIATFGSQAAGATPSSYLSHLTTVTNIGSTVPADGDVNPYGITVVPQTTGNLVKGDTLVSNFNDAANLQGTGTTIVQISPGGWVVVGSLPTTDGTSATAQAGCLIVLDSSGHAVETWSGGTINGPWDLTAVSAPWGATIFVSNVLNGTVAASRPPASPSGPIPPPWW
jgi:hypothetical protein